MPLRRGGGPAPSQPAIDITPVRSARERQGKKEGTAKGARETKKAGAGRRVRGGVGARVQVAVEEKGGGGQSHARGGVQESGQAVGSADNKAGGGCGA